MKSFARVTKLSNITGRADYISNEKRQENNVAKSTPVDWEPYHEFEVANQKTAQRNNEGREFVLALPNAWATLPRAELSEKAHRLSVVAPGKETDLQWAVHWNKDHTNLHMHVVFSERKRNLSFRSYDRDIYLTADGKVVRKKADRAKGADGRDLPPVYRKGECIEQKFTAEDSRYKARSWVAEVKENLWQELTRMGAQLEPQEMLHQYHEGKGTDAPAIKEKNEAVKLGNILLKQAKNKYTDSAILELYITVAVWIGTLIDSATGATYIRTAIVLFYVGNEGISLIENFGLMGVPYPPAMKKALEALREKGEKTE